MRTLTVMLLTAGLMAPTPAPGQPVKVKGRGEVVYQGTFQPGSDEKQNAILQAKRNALSRHAAEMPPARLQLYRSVESEIWSQLDHYITDYVQIGQQVDTSARRYTVTIEASINATLIEDTLQRASLNAGGGNKDAFFTFVFVARELASRRVFDVKRTVVEGAERSESTAETLLAGPDGQSAEAQKSTETITKKSTGGSVEAKADELTYRVTTVTEVDNAVNAVLARARYETVDAADAGIDVASFRSDFSKGDDISAETRAAAIRRLRENGIQLLAIASMDVGLPEKDEVSGLVRIHVMVTAKVSDLNGRLPRTVASIAGRPFAGLGPNAQVARQNALNAAAAQAAMDLVDQLRVKNLR